MGGTPKRRSCKICCLVSSTSWVRTTWRTSRRLPSHTRAPRRRRRVVPTRTTKTFLIWWTILRLTPTAERAFASRALLARPPHTHTNARAHTHTQTILGCSECYFQLLETDVVSLSCCLQGISFNSLAES